MSPENLTIEHIQRIADSLIEIRCLPRRCDFSRIGPLFMASFYDEEDPNALIRESTQAGMDLNRDLAALKGIVECVERLAYSEGHVRGLFSCSTPRSDGLAAFPVNKNSTSTSMKRARENAYSEAVERYVWAVWWDDHEIACDILELSPENIPASVVELKEAVESLVPAERWLCIRPKVKSSTHEVLIFFLFLKEGGLVSGGACGQPEDRLSTMLRALGELARHAEGARRIQQRNVQATTFYEKRLRYMLTSEASESLEKRMSRSGHSEIILPELLIDEAVPHRLDRLVSVHRCFFVNQPPFVGGEIERLCL